jgi:hypothetical protein
MIIKPTKDITLDCFVDANFAGFFSTSDPDNPKSVKSRSGYVITLGQIPVSWESCSPKLPYPRWRPSTYLYPKLYASSSLFVYFVGKQSPAHFFIHLENRGSVEIQKVFTYVLASFSTRAI